MKTLKRLTTCTVMVLIAMYAVAQDPKTPLTPIGEEGRLPDQLEKKNVPDIVTQNYYRDYPSATVESWYVYPEYTYMDGTDWYVYSPSLVGGAPEYYLVEFTTDKTPHKVVYSKTGQRMSTYRGMSSNLPKPVTDALKKSSYKSWKIVNEKEEIWRESDKKKVYKIVVEKEKEKHALYYQEDGKLLKDKNLTK
jgi:hypothetical protein